MDNFFDCFLALLSFRIHDVVGLLFKIGIWDIISQLPQHFMSHFSIVSIFSEFVCLLDVSLLPKVQTFVTTPFQITGGGIFTHNVHHGIFTWQ